MSVPGLGPALIDLHLLDKSAEQIGILARAGFRFQASVGVVPKDHERIRPGPRDLFISVGLCDGTPAIALPLPNDDGQRRYRLGRIELVRP